MHTTIPTNVQKFVYILHPYRGQNRPGERKANLDQIEAIALHLLGMGHVPISPIHCMGFLNDENPVQREQGLALCRPWIEKADLILAYVLPPGRPHPAYYPLPPDFEWPSDGCRRDHEHAVALGKDIEYKTYIPVPICETPSTRV